MLKLSAEEKDKFNTFIEFIEEKREAA